MEPGKNELLYRKMRMDDVAAVHALVQGTITTSYKDAYSANAMEFFKRYHDVDNIVKEVHEGHCILAIYDGVTAGVGELLVNKIRMVFVEPSLQGLGIGRGLMMRLQDRARENGLDELHLESSVVAVGFYKHMGYEVVQKTYLDLEGGGTLPYFIMKHRL